MFSFAAVIAWAMLFQPQLTALEQFFSGRTQGSGSVSILFSGTSRVRTEGQGRVLRDGTFVLEHVVHQEGERDRRRVWRMRRAGPNRYTGTISDARGEVTAEVNGRRVQVSYQTQDGYWVSQVVTISPDGRSATNRTRFRRLGVNVATLNETIRKLD